MSYFSNFGLNPVVPEPFVNGVSKTIPGQAPMLKYLIGAIKRGEVLNVKVAMSYDNLPKFGDPVVSSDLRHLTSSDIDVYLSTFSSDPEPNPIGGDDIG